MAKYIAKRLLMMIPVLIGISFILFTVLKMTPGDPARMILGESALQEDVEALREEMGLNDNFFVQYFNYMKGVVKGDLGKSYTTNLPVTQEILARIPTTFLLAVLSMTICIVIGLPIGILSAVKQYTLVDSASMICALILTSMPSFWFGLMLILFFSLKLNLLPSVGIDTWKHFILPSVTLAATTMAVLLRMMRSTMLEVIRQDYIMTARAKGANERRVVFRHALKNAFLPVLTVIGINFGIQLGGAVIVENVFAIPGLGTLMVDAVKMKDLPTVIGSVMFVALIAGLVNLLVDILYVYIDPRIKSQYVK